MPLYGGGLLGDYHIRRDDELPPMETAPLKGVGLLSSDEEMRAYLQMLQQRLQQNDIQRGPATWDDARRGRLWQGPETQALPPLGFPEEYRYRNPNSNLLNPGGGYSWPGIDMGQN